MTTTMRMLWAREFRRLFRTDRYRVAVKRPDGACVIPAMGDGPWNAGYCADPFLFRHNGENWLFYETLDAKGKGVLGCFRERGGEWVNEGIVLEEPFHLSYPQVFELDGRIYMLPETTGSGEVRLYESADFPRGWKKAATLIEGQLADATLLECGGRWYLAGLQRRTRIPGLWHAPALLGPWREHPKSGNVNRSARLRRCGGPFLEEDGRLWRMAQDCNGEYGRRLFRVPVLSISEGEYSEGAAERFPLPGDWPEVPGKWHTYGRMDVPEGRYEVIDVLDHPLKSLPSRIAGALSLVAHQLFRIRHKGGGLLVQFCGLQYVRGRVRRQPALVSLGGRRRG